MTNLNWFVDDIAHAQDLLGSLGAGVLIEGPSYVAMALGDYGTENTRKGADQRPFLFMGTHDMLGFDLEILEPNFVHFTRQNMQYPAFVEPRPRNHRDLELHRLQVGVPNLGEALRSIATIFSPVSRSKPYTIRVDRNCRSCRISLGGIELEYIETSERGVAAVVFGTTSAQLILSACADAGLHSSLAGLESLSGATYRIASRSTCGFDVLLENHEDRVPN